MVSNPPLLVFRHGSSVRLVLCLRFVSLLAFIFFSFCIYLGSVYVLSSSFVKCVCLFPFYIFLGRTSKYLGLHPVAMMLVQNEMYWPPFNRSPGKSGASRFTSLGPSPSLEQKNTEVFRKNRKGGCEGKTAVVIVRLFRSIFFF